MICVNLDKFRLINDVHGYQVGNELLQLVAGKLADYCPVDSSIFREGGDEFLMVFPERKGSDDIGYLLEKIMATLNDEVQVGETRISLSVSAGVALYPQDGEKFEELVSNSSIAMGRAKEQGGECYAFFTQKIDQGIRTRFNIAQLLHHAIARNELTICYQPQIDSLTKRIISAEALLRWSNPEIGQVSPGEFIPIAEKSGRILEIDKWVTRTVCEQIAAWQADGLAGIKVAVNLSGRQFVRPDAVDNIQKVLEETGIPPCCLEIEITESAIIEDVEHAIETMHRLKEIGVPISLDDFGTGYSSLSYLKKFPIDYLKIDQSFVNDLGEGPDASAIVLSIIDLAHHLRMQVIAEGVETQSQSDFLESNGCDIFQGYLYGRPVSADEFRRQIVEQEAGRHPMPVEIK